MNDNIFVYQELPTSTSSLRVAVVTETYPPEVNGVAMTLGRIVDGLQRRNHRVQLIRPRQHATETPAHDVHLEEVDVGPFQRPESGHRLFRLVDAFAGMRARVPQARLVMVGDGPERAALSARHPEIVFAGTRTGEDLAAHYASADIFLFSSLTGTFGNVTLAAMASGLAVVAYDYVAAQQYLAHERSGLLAPIDADPVLATSLRVQARASAEHIDWDNVFDDVEAVLRDVIERQEAGRV